MTVAGSASRMFKGILLQKYPWIGGDPSWMGDDGWIYPFGWDKRTPNGSKELATETVQYLRPGSWSEFGIHFISVKAAQVPKLREEFVDGLTKVGCCKARRCGRTLTCPANEMNATKNSWDDVKDPSYGWYVLILSWYLGMVYGWVYHMTIDDDVVMFFWSRPRPRYLDSRC